MIRMRIAVVLFGAHLLLVSSLTEHPIVQTTFSILTITGGGITERDLTVGLSL